MVTIKPRILEGSVVGPRPVGGSRFLKGHFCVWKKIAGQDQPVSWVSPTAHRNIFAFLRGKRWSSNRATCCWRVSLPAIFSTRTNPASNESLFSVRVFLPLKKRESFHIKKCTATFLCYLLGLLWQATDTKPQEIQVQQRSGICFWKEFLVPAPAEKMYTYLKKRRSLWPQKHDSIGNNIFNGEKKI